MWGIDFNLESGRTQLPLITSESIVFMAATLLCLRIFIHYVLERCFNVRVVRKEHSQNALQYSYFYHLSIIILALPQVNWNIFDIFVWVYSYVCIGMLRKAIFIINIERDFMLNDYAYNNQIILLLTNSLISAVVLGLIGIASALWINFSFLGVRVSITTMLSFPPIMLIIDSVYLFLLTWKTHKHLVCFYNMNVDMPVPTYKLEVFHSINSSAVKLWHFFNLTMMSIRIYEKIDFLDCLWVTSVLGAFYTSASTMVRSVSKYRKMQKLFKNIDHILTKAMAANNEICIICMEPLLNSHRLINCGHIFHYKCMFQWIQTKEECPICRMNINLQI